MNAIKKWTKRKPPEIAILTTALASGAQSFHDLLQACRNQAIFKAFHITPSPGQWLGFYLDHKQIESAIKKTSAKESRFISKSQQFIIEQSRI